MCAKPVSEKVLASNVQEEVLLGRLPMGSKIQPLER
jgi:hypothetical protein